MKFINPGGSLSVHTKGPTPRNEHYGVGAVPISLPKMSDFWRGNPIGATKYGDGINYQTHGGEKTTNNSSPPMREDNSHSIQRLHTM